jgi:hypothetical protein
MARAQDTVTVVLDRRTAENHFYALALALGGAGPLIGPGKKGKGKGKGKGNGKYPSKPGAKGTKR